MKGELHITAFTATVVWNEAKEQAKALIAKIESEALK